MLLLGEYVQIKSTVSNIWKERGSKRNNKEQQHESHVCPVCDFRRSWEAQRKRLANCLVLST